MQFENYQTGSFYDEMVDDKNKIREHYKPITQRLGQLSKKKLMQLHRATDKAQWSIGMTFNVYSDDEGEERILPLDIIPRVISQNEWQEIDKGLKQRIYALNLFLHDVYNEKKILKDKVVPEELVYSTPGYLEACEGLSPINNIWCHITGSDLVRDQNGSFYVLEDNLRCPSGVSYLLENREILKRTFPELFESLGVRHVSEYPMKLRGLLEHVAPCRNPLMAVLTPGTYNSAYFEHSYLAAQMGVELVEGRDLFVENDFVYMSTTHGAQKVDVLYRRIDDTFMDPDVFNPDSLLGVRGLFEAYKKGNVNLVNAPGTGIADDKAIYAYVPDIIKYYLDEDPLIPNVPTWICRRKEEMDYVIENMDQLVIKQTNAAGGYGMLIGPAASKEEIESFRQKVKAKPENYIAQPTLALSTVPTMVEDRVEGRHVDLRPYILYGEEIYVLPGGLTRVALKKDSLVVNSSQGGGSKDTWVLYQ